MSIVSGDCSLRFTKPQRLVTTDHHMAHPATAVFLHLRRRIEHLSIKMSYRPGNTDWHQELNVGYPHGHVLKIRSGGMAAKVISPRASDGDIVLTVRPAKLRVLE